MRPGTDANAACIALARSSSVTCNAPPSSNQMITSSVFTPPARSLNVASAARRINSRAMAWPPTSSPSYSSSILPVMAGCAAYTSEMRGTISSSPVTMARRSELETTFSITLIGMRCDTPDRRSMRLSVRASNAMRSTTSAMKSGTRTVFASRVVHDSCAVMAMPSSTVSG